MKIRLSKNICEIALTNSCKARLHTKEHIEKMKLEFIGAHDKGIGNIFIYRQRGTGRYFSFKILKGAVYDKSVLCDVPV